MMPPMKKLNRHKDKRTLRSKPDTGATLQLHRMKLNGSLRTNLMRIPQKRKQTMSAYQANIIICLKREWHNQTLRSFYQISASLHR